MSDETSSPASFSPPRHADPRTNDTEVADSGHEWSWVRPTVTIGSLVLSVLNPPVGLVGSIGSLVWANRAGTSKTIPIIGIVVSVVLIFLTIVLAVVALVVFRNAVRDGAFDLNVLCARRDSWSSLLDLAGYECE